MQLAENSNDRPGIKLVDCSTGMEWWNGTVESHLRGEGVGKQVA